MTKYAHYIVRKQKHLNRKSCQTYGNLERYGLRGLTSEEEVRIWNSQETLYNESFLRRVYFSIQNFELRCGPGKIPQAHVDVLQQILRKALHGGSHSSLKS